MRLWVLMGAVAVSSCASEQADPTVTVCEGVIRGGLDNPDSYSRRTVGIDPTADDGTRTVSITYDEANQYGTVKQGVQHCVFKMEADGSTPAIEQLQKDAQTAVAESKALAAKGSDDFRRMGDTFGTCCIPTENAN